MKGDFSRIRFNPAKQYTSVLQQQGRVALDADANEQCLIDESIRDLTNCDVIGTVGGPAGNAGFKLTLEGSQILIGAGRYYVNGILVENFKTYRYDDQPYLNPNPIGSQALLSEVLNGGGSVTAQFILEVWQRLVTDLDDSCLREPALGQADTTARLQTVWRVVGMLNDPRLINGLTDLFTNPPYIAAPTSTAPNLTTSADAYLVPFVSGCANAMQNPAQNLSSCCQSMYQPTVVSRTGSMGAGTSTSSDCGCQPVAPAGYQGLENQLYRVEIHQCGTLDTATFKWSRENASVVTSITAIHGAIVTVSSLGPDANLGFQAGQWVELSDDTYEFGIPPNSPGELYQISSVQPSTMQVTMTTPVSGIRDRNPRMRRWDQSGVSATATGIQLSSTPVQLENGIEVTFSTGDYVSGDYWTIPARTADGQIDWPPCGALGSQFFQPATFIPIFTAPLACIHARLERGQGTDTGLDATELKPYPTIDDVTADERHFVVDDCRLLFPPLTALCGSSTPSAMHVVSTSWNNDDYMTFDTLVANGLTVTLDQAPVSPVTGASFAVTFEIADKPIENKDTLALGAGEQPSNLLRSIVIVDSYKNVSAEGTTLSWQLPQDQRGRGQVFLLEHLDLLLSSGAPFGWFARVRVRLMGRAIYANGAAGQLYLDGQTFGQPATRVDGTNGVGLQIPSGNGEKASDFESWFYLAPTVLIANVVIQGIENGVEKTVPAIMIRVDDNGNILGLQTGETRIIQVTQLQALITFNYAPIAPVTVTLSWLESAAAAVLSIAATVNAPAGKISYAVPITPLTNPGPVTETFHLAASVTTALGNVPFDPQPSLAVTGMTQPQTPTQ